MSMGAYYLWHLNYAPFTGRMRMIDMSPERERVIGTISFNSFLANHNVLPPNHPSTILVKRVGYRIAQAAGMNDLPWEFKVVDSPMINAACLPGGKVVVFNGLLQLLNYREDALAVVLAHEAAHVLARHTAEKLAFTQLLLWAEFAVNLVFQARFMTNWISALAVRLPYGPPAGDGGGPHRPAAARAHVPLPARGR
eukprot:CAMPEP_0113661512 /NCGR_PEP_ID=MMETSP0038_2-20120614/10_1 /TAXON_ID=2898 /ORGANISM="Cryptomonas paramecium" /LENGTH=195 /DNA_ID=CAMNT_0000576201 /DNA_START=226 /DNA_END=810 /DNA_ORIENTATION=+ /assembly_acc=CAM_ASM_000170